MSLPFEGPEHHDKAVAKAVEALRDALPPVAPFAVWRNQDLRLGGAGRRLPVSLLALGRDGLWVVHVEARTGEVIGEGALWRHRVGGRTRVVEAPYPQLAAVADALRTLLAAAHRGAALPSVPRVHTALLFASPVVRGGDLERGATPVFTSAEDLAARLQAAPDQPDHLVTHDARAPIVAALRAGGLHDAEVHRVGDYRLTELLDDHDTWQEHRAVHVDDPGRTARVRTWILPRADSDSQRASLARAVCTESSVLRVVGDHPSILSLHEVAESTHGLPRLVFEDFDGLPLNRFLAAHPTLTMRQRVDVILAVGDALAHCHRHEVLHRNLSPGAVLARLDGDRVVVRLHRFEAALASDSQSTQVGTGHVSAFANRMDDLYRAPEAFGDPLAADVTAELFSLGALTWFVLAGRHPGPTLKDRHRQIVDNEGLPLWQVLDGPDPRLVDLVAGATRWFPDDRLIDEPAEPGAKPRSAPMTVPRFLDRLRALFPAEVDREHAAIDPLTAQVGERLDSADGSLEVQRVLGRGATSVVLQVGLEDGRTAALKLPQEPRFAAHLASEARALRAVHPHDHIVELYGEPTFDSPAGPITGLLMQLAGSDTLADRVRADGPLSLDYAGRLGTQLLSAVAHLHARGVRHRDLKPANLAFDSVRHEAFRLVLFDFSLTEVAPDQISAGTPGWRDPFLGETRWAWDDEADLYGAGACLYFALTGERPLLASRGPLKGTVPVEPTRFDAAVRSALTRFFERAFARELTERFRDADAMLDAWRTVFDDDTTSLVDPVDATAPDADALRRQARLDTPVGRLGLSARAVDGLERAGVFDVRDLLGLPRNRLSGVRGVGRAVQHEIQAAARELHARLGDRPDAAARPFVGPLPGLPRGLDDAELPLDDAQRVVLRDAGLRSTHDLAMHGADALQRLLGLPPADAEALRTALLASAPATELTGALADWVRTLLSPHSPSKRTMWETRVRLLTGLDPMPHDAPLGARSNAEAAAACGDTRTVFRASFQKARAYWAKHQAVADDAVAAVLAAVDGPVAPLVEVAEALVQRHAPAALRATDDARTQAAALIRFATEHELPHAALHWQRLGDEAWVARDPAALTALAQAAEALTALASGDGPVTAEAALQALAPFEPLAALPAAQRLIHVARAALGVALSSRGEVYDATLTAQRAVELAAPVLQRGALTPAEVVRRVRGRFPAGQPLPERPALDALLAPLGLVWSADRGAYLRPDSAGASLSVGPSTRVTVGSTGSPVQVEAARFRRDLKRHLEAGGFRVLQVSARKAEQARAHLVAAFPELEVTSLDQAVSDGLIARVHATEGAQLDPILELERTRTPAAHHALLLQQFIRPVLAELVDRVLTAREQRPQLLIHPGLLARYDAREALDHLVRTASEEGHGAVWLLLPALDDGGPPVIRHPLHTVPVPLSRPSQSLRIPHRWLAADALAPDAP